MANQYYQMTYNVDLVFCIDVTGSMSGILDTVKANALKFHGDLTKKMEEKSKQLGKLRIRIVAFRDYGYDGENSMLCTDFFEFPENQALFVRAVNSLQPFGGGDEPEDGLEALAYAMSSKWNREEGQKARQVIVVWTDTGVHPIGTHRNAPNYPKGMPQSFEELTTWWAQEPDAQGARMDFSAERLIIFAPDESDWKRISDNWENSIHIPTVAGKGMREVDYKEILDCIAETVAVDVQSSNQW